MSIVRQFYTCLLSAQFYLHSFICTVLSAQFYLHSFICTVLSAQFYLHSFICTVLSAQLPRLERSNANCTGWFVSVYASVKGSRRKNELDRSTAAGCVNTAALCRKSFRLISYLHFSSVDPPVIIVIIFWFNRCFFQLLRSYKRHEENKRKIGQERSSMQQADYQCHRPTP